MFWTISYRDDKGQRVEKEIEASDRTALFAELKRRGITAINIRECLKPEKYRSGSRSAGLRGVRLLPWAVASILAIVCILAIVLLKKDNPGIQVPSRQHTKPHSITQGTPATPVQKISTPDEVYQEKPEAPTYVMVGRRRVYRSPTNDVGKVVTNAFGQALVIERVVTPNGPMKDGKSLVPRRIFTYDSEVAIDTLMNMEIGYKSLMMLPPNMDSDFEKSLSEKIVINPEDTEDEIRRKNDMIAVKKELSERVAAGEKVSVIAAETLAHYNKIADMRDTLQQEIIEMEKSNASAEEIEELYEAANIMLKEYDALPLHSPKVRKAIIRERLDRKKARQQKK